MKGNSNLMNHWNTVVEQVSLTSYKLGMQHRFLYLDHGNETCFCYPLNVSQVSIKTQSCADYSYLAC